MVRQPLPVRLGRAIRRAREAAELSQEALADACGMHRTYIGAVERGERNVTILSLERICKPLGEKPSAMLAAAGM